MTTRRIAPVDGAALQPAGTLWQWYSADHGLSQAAADFERKFGYKAELVLIVKPGGEIAAGPVREVDPLDAAEPDAQDGFVWSDVLQSPDMFASAGRVDDMPLFSGTAPRQAAIQPFVPSEPPARQERMF